MTSMKESWQWLNDHADHYEEIVTCAADFGRYLVDYADPTPGTRLLDVGAGRGAVARAALARGCVVTAVDAAPRMVELLASDLPEITVRRMDASRLTFPDGSFDIVTAGCVVDMVDHPAATIAEMRRVLPPGGTVALSVQGPTRDRWLWLTRLSDEFWPAPTPDDTAPTLDVVALLTAAGFVDLTQKTVEEPLPIPSPTALWDRLMSQVSTTSIEWLPADRTAEFHRRFLAGAEHMHTHGGITLDRDAIFHRGRSPRSRPSGS
jgi:SAM-dependent methyltransferase